MDLLITTGIALAAAVAGTAVGMLAGWLLGLALDPILGVDPEACARITGTLVGCAAVVAVQLVRLAHMGLL